MKAAGTVRVIGRDELAPKSPGHEWVKVQLVDGFWANYMKLVSKDGTSAWRVEGFAHYSRPQPDFERKTVLLAPIGAAGAIEAGMLFDVIEDE